MVVGLQSVTLLPPNAFEGYITYRGWYQRAYCYSLHRIIEVYEQLVQWVLLDLKERVE